MDFLQGIALELWVAVALALAGLSAFDDAVASLVSRIPGIGPALAPVLRRLSVNFREWMRAKVAASAEAAVKQTEGAIPAAPGAVKASRAAGTLRKAEPGLTRAEAERETQAAFDRMMGDAALATAAVQKAAAEVASSSTRRAGDQTVAR